MFQCTFAAIVSLWKDLVMSNPGAMRGLKTVTGILSCTYVEAVGKLHKAYMTAFEDDRVTMSSTLAAIYDRSTGETRLHLRRGFV